MTEDDLIKWRCSLILHSLIKCLPTIDTATVDLTTRLVRIILGYIMYCAYLR